MRCLWRKSIATLKTCYLPPCSFRGEGWGIVGKKIIEIAGKVGVLLQRQKHKRILRGFDCFRKRCFLKLLSTQHHFLTRRDTIMQHYSYIFLQQWAFLIMNICSTMSFSLHFKICIVFESILLWKWQFWNFFDSFLCVFTVFFDNLAKLQHGWKLYVS